MRAGSHEKSLLLEVDCCRDPESLPPPAQSFQEALTELPNLQDARIAWSSDLGGICPVDPEVQSVCHTAVQWFSSQGASVAEACPDLSDAEEIFQVRKAAVQETLDEPKTLRSARVAPMRCEISTRKYKWKMPLGPPQRVPLI